MTPASEATAGLCVLVVEDDEADAYLISRTLLDNPEVGQVVRATDGVEALRMVECDEVSPDLALVDLHMPRMNGFDLLVALTSRARSSFPIVVLTSSTAPADAIRGRLRGAIRALIKPDTVTELYVILKAAIDEVCPRGARAALVARDRSPEYLLMSKPFHRLRRPTASD